ncbi:uncharacterized protein [Mytilus edulis]|uniref:uncharacterized protein n=1 Tax=Mytilus edulis TaxID=6550 RepID=UPI0039EF22C9
MKNSKPCDPNMSLFIGTVVFFFYFVSGKDSPGECFRNVWNKALQTNERVNYCCHDYENRNGTCIECRRGYTSTDGRQCQQCKKQWFGKKCLQSCECTEYQRCHHVEGCVNKLQLTTSQMTTEDYSTSFSLMTKMYEGKTEEDKRKKEDNNQVNAIFSQQIVVYSMCGAGLLIVITICYVCAKRLKYNRTTNRQNDNNGVNRLPEIPRDLPNPVLINQEHLVQFESLYDEIDEVSSDKNNAPLEKHDKTSVQSKSESSESDSDEKMEHDGYLNPYQQIVKDTADSHDYNTAIADASKSMEIDLKNRQETGYIDAISSNNPNERKYLELLDLQCMNFFNECEVVNDFNAQQLNPSQNMQCSRVEDFLISKKHSTSTFQLSSEKNTSKQKPKRLSI